MPEGKMDGLEADAVVELAELGASGGQPQNVSRDLIKAHTAFKILFKSCEPSSLSLTHSKFS